jgi:flagellar FliL protein
MRLFLIFAIFLLNLPAAFAEEETDSEEAPTIVYLPLKQQFTVNLLGKKHYLRTTIQLQLKNETIKETIEANDPVIRHALIVLLSNNKVEDISTLAGKEKLRKNAVTTLNETLKTYTKTDGVTDVFFTEFVSQ